MKASPEQIEVWEAWIAACLEVEHKLSTWELNFVESIADQLTHWGRLSERQAEILERIYAEKA